MKEKNRAKKIEHVASNNLNCVGAVWLLQILLVIIQVTKDDV